MEQRNGSNSTNNQAQTIVINQGFNYEQVKEIFNDLFDANFYRLHNIAKETALQRVGKFQEKFIALLAEEGITDISKFGEPEFQYALFDAQKTCAKKEEIQYRELASKALLFKIKNEDNNLLDIVLSESISTIDKLLPAQLDILALSFIIGSTVNSYVKSYYSLEHYVKKYIVPFSNNIEFKYSNIQHLEYCKCGTNLIGDKIEERFKKRYEQVFCMPLIKEEILPYLHEDTLENLISSGVLEEDINLIRNDVKDNDVVYRVNTHKESNELLKYERLVSFYNERKLNEEQVKQCLLNIDPKMSNIVNNYNNVIKSFTLTSVGLIVGAIHYENITNDKVNLSLWL